MLESRPCPVCDATSSELVYQQKFTSMPGLEDISFQQDVVCCDDCGMIYVNKYISDDLLANYYSAMSCYEYPESGFEFPESHKRMSQQQYQFLANHRRAYGRILDVGCSLGYTLSLFKASGSAVLGIEPSPILKDVAMRQYGVEVRTEFLGAGSDIGGRFDLIILSHVVEHLKSPQSLLSTLGSALAEGGVVFVEVPTIEEFDERDLFQFSFEHINYFSHGSLANLMHGIGFEEVNHIIFENDDGTAPFYSTLGTLWRKTKEAKRPLINRRQHDRAVIRRYVGLIEQHVGRLHATLRDLVNSNQRIAVWGGGTFTAQLLAQTPLSGRNVTVVYDSDPKKAGLSIAGVPIRKPDMSENFMAQDGIDVIVIGSWSSQEEIYHSLRAAGGVAEDKIVRLFKLSDLT